MKIVELSTPGTRLSIQHSQLLVSRPGEQYVTIPVEDIGVVIVDDVQASYTQSVFIELLDAGAVIVIAGRNHLPAGVMLPVVGHHEQSSRHQLQLDATKPRCKRAWQQIVKAKIRLQGVVLELATTSDHGLLKLAGRVRSGDPENREAQAAQRYWPLLFGAKFRRNRELPGINSLLNYGYAVLRATISRAIVASGLIPTIGLQHRNRRNPFCLADDLLEPYRQMIDARVLEISQEYGDQGSELTRTNRARILTVLNERVELGGNGYPVSVGISRTVQSLVSYFSRDCDALMLPDSVPRSPPGESMESRVPRHGH